MALTKISTGGVKDDAASQAKIADEAVDEARLQISNDGSNGQFLSKQSGNTGGLTWSDVPAQYTHPNHSGEVTSTADGAQVIADNIVDEANLKVSNSPTNGQFLSAQSGNTGGLTWAEAGGGAWEVVYTKDLRESLPSTGGYNYVENYGWTNNYARYKVTFDGLTRAYSGSNNTFKLWIQWYMASSGSSTGQGTLFTGSAYMAKGANIGGSAFTNGTSTKWGPYNDASSYRLSGEVTIPMFDSGSEDINKHMYATWVEDDELYMEKCHVDANNAVMSDHIKGIQIKIVNANQDMNGRITFLRQKYS